MTLREALEKNKWNYIRIDDMFKGSLVKLGTDWLEYYENDKIMGQWCLDQPISAYDEEPNADYYEVLIVI